MTGESIIDREQLLKQELRDRLTNDDGPLPYLFFGSGMSLRYLGLPTWEGLMIEFANRSNLNARFELSQAEGNYPKMASSLANAFHHIWFNSEEYAGQRDKYPEALGQENILKIAVSEYLLQQGKLVEGVPGVDNAELKAEIETLRQAKVDGIITTNYDTLVEELFPHYPAFNGQTDLLLGGPQFIGEIYKIHGSVLRPESLILTEEDYSWLDRKNPYLMAKLVTIFAEHPIIFAGYSVEDEYIETMLVELTKAVGTQQTKKFTQKFYFLEYDNDQKAIPSISENRVVNGDSLLSMTVIRTNSYGWVWEVLADLKRPIPTNFLRQIKEQIYDIVANPAPDEERDTVHSVPYGEGGDDLKFVYGFGQFSETQIDEIREMGNSWSDGFAGSKLRREDLLRDVLGLKGPDVPAEMVLEFGITEHIEPQDTEYIPVHKYLAEDGRIQEGSIDFAGLPPQIKKLADRKVEPYAQQKAAFNREFSGRSVESITVSDIMTSTRSTQFKLDALVYVLMESPQSDELLEDARNILVSQFDEAQSTVFNKAVVAYSRAKWFPNR